MGITPKERNCEKSEKSPKKIREIFGTQRQKKPNFEHVKKNVDPSTHYDLVGKLGEGAFGDVWKAKNRITQKYAAAKIIETGSEAEIEEHYGEIEILIKCDHQNIVKCVDSTMRISFGY